MRLRRAQRPAGRAAPGPRRPRRTAALNRTRRAPESRSLTAGRPGRMLCAASPRQEVLMPSTDQPVPFTADDYRARMTRAAESADAAGLAGVLVAPGPDMVHLTGYRPTAETERLTLLVLRAGHDPVLVVPALEAADAERASRRPRPHPEGLDRRREPLHPHRRTPARQGPVRDQRQRLGAAPAGPAQAPARQLLRLAHRRPAHAAGGQGRGRAGTPRRGGGRRRRDVRADPEGPLLRPHGRARWPPIWPRSSRNTATPRSTSPWWGRAPTAPTRTTRRATAPSSGATWSSWTSAA